MGRAAPRGDRLARRRAGRRPRSRRLAPAPERRDRRARSRRRPRRRAPDPRARSRARGPARSSCWPLFGASATSSCSERWRTRRASLRSPIPTSRWRAWRAMRSSACARRCGGSATSRPTRPCTRSDQGQAREVRRRAGRAGRWQARRALHRAGRRSSRTSSASTRTPSWPGERIRALAARRRGAASAFVAGRLLERQVARRAEILRHVPQTVAQTRKERS